MKKLGLVYFVLMLLLVVSCSKSSKQSDPEKSTESVAKESDKNESESESEDLVLDENDLEETKEEELISDSEQGSTDSIKDKDEMKLELKDSIGVSKQGQKKEIDLGLSPGVYKVRKGETLMLIAFKLYGDYGKWKKIQQNNPQLKGKPLRAGMELSYDAPKENFDWSPQGLPHLIRRGDTLGKISKNKYGTSKKWKTIWDNNRPLIKDPNLIFAGFTLYYVPLGKELASW